MIEKREEIDLAAYGFDGRFAALAGEYDPLVAGRILSQEKGIYRVISGMGEQLAEVSGKFRYRVEAVSEYPAVGDFVMLDTNDMGRAVIHHVLPRKSVFVRKAAGTAKLEQVVAANIDTVFCCMSLNLDFNLRRLERYLSTGWDSGAIPVVVLTKADLCEDISEKVREVEQAAAGVDILVTSALAGEGYEKILPYIKKGQTVALLGSSGVGKSTLINALLGEYHMSTNGLRDDDKGRHTTTHRELLLLKNGGIVIDTPGMRELGMWDVAEGVDRAFSDIEEIAAGCRFADCRHNGEPGCAVRAAIDCGELDEARLKSYQKLRTEADYAAGKTNYLSQKEKKFKTISKINKSSRGRH